MLEIRKNFLRQQTICKVFFYWDFLIFEVLLAFAYFSKVSRLRGLGKSKVPNLFWVHYAPLIENLS